MEDVTDLCTTNLAFSLMLFIQHGKRSIILCSLFGKDILICTP